MTEFRFLNSGDGKRDGGKRYIAPAAGRVLAANLANLYDSEPCDSEPPGAETHVAGTSGPDSPDLATRALESNSPNKSSVGGLPRFNPWSKRQPLPGKADHQHAIRRDIAALKREHRSLDDAISTLMSSAPGAADELRLRRLKKHKLHLKDRIAGLQIQLVPDIPA